MSGFELTRLDSIFDKNVGRCEHYDSLKDFVMFFKTLSETPFEKKSEADLITPAVFKTVKGRKNENVLHWGRWAAIDVDDKISGNLREHLKPLQAHKFLIYSTASSRVEHPKFRVVVFLSECVPAEEIRHFWQALVRYSSLNADKQCKDLSRVYYTPGQYKGAYNFFKTSLNGSYLRPREIMKAFPYVEPENGGVMSRLPPEMQKKYLKEKAARLTNGNHTWNGYRDCRFIPKGLLKEYDEIAHMDGSGRYHHVYRMMTGIAVKAVKSGYPITPSEIESLIREIDSERSNLYKKRPIALEAERAIEYALKNC